ncbi:MAG: SLC13 family permease [Bacteroidales bacterium]|nr:SLC13 family permease [Bacteroidales bacterium]MCF8350947.1 SLC13 family permease [Bacteroidales bacterium]MCF8376554.1 SLC13 family permease [Bacteroidales bacterium]MCF8400594.1 SLC13 family permease [Bacteroidales bacterium]
MITSGTNYRRLIGLTGGPLLFFVTIFFLDLRPGRPEVTYTLAAALWMATWWISEVVPLAITSLLPVALFPLLGIMDGKNVSATYFNHVIFLFIGGFIVALAMQKWDLHKRIALKILINIGTGPGRIMLGFMIATAFLSMWISNTATTMMMVPILLSVIAKLEESSGSEAVSKYAIGLLLGVAYSASVGGIATLVGTPPNLSFARIFQIYFPEAPMISFAQWFFFALPVSVVFIAITWTYLYFRFRPDRSSWKRTDTSTFKMEYKKLGKISYEQIIVLIDFILLALLWLTRSDIDTGLFIIPGWATVFSVPDYINDGTVAIMMSIPLFFIPSKDKKNIYLMDWETATKLPWNIVLLFGGGFALATGFKESGLSLWFGEQLSWVVGAHPLLIIAMIAFLMTFLTELTSNTATTEMLLPILAGLSVSVEINPLLFMLPATLAGSMAFMLPVATPPNAIIFGSTRIKIADMVRTGFVLNIIGVIIVTLATYFLGRYVFDIQIDQFPFWAKITH